MPTDCTCIGLYCAHRPAPSILTDKAWVGVTAPSAADLAPSIGAYKPDPRNPDFLQEEVKRLTVRLEALAEKEFEANDRNYAYQIIGHRNKEIDSLQDQLEVLTADYCREHEAREEAEEEVKELRASISSAEPSCWHASRLVWFAVGLVSCFIGTVVL